MSRVRGQRRDRRLSHVPSQRTVSRRPDPYHLGIREARADVPKTSSTDWVAGGRPAADWYAYSSAYDGRTQR